MNWRARFAVLVVQAETLGAIGVIRSLGRAGYRVHACSTEPEALGLRSRFAAGHVICPGYQTPHFLPWLRQYLAEHGIRAIVPSESLLHAVRPVFSEFAPLLTCGGSEPVVYAGLSKFELTERLLRERRASDEHLPPTLLIERLDRLPSRTSLELLGRPLYVKVDAGDSTSGERGTVVKAESPEAALARLEAFGGSFRRALVQGHVPGRGVGAFFLLHEGRVIAEFMHRRLHEVPYTGGASSHRESWFHAGIRDDALARLGMLGWQGVAMMEYRLDEATGRFSFLEMNGRFWGSLHLALYAGVDFPRLLLDAFFGRVPSPVRRYPLGVRCRHTFPAELQHVWSRLRASPVGVREKAESVAEFFALGADPRVRADLLFPGDRALYLHGMVSGFREVLGGLRRRWKGSSDAQGAQAGISAGKQAGGALPARAAPHAR